VKPRAAADKRYTPHCGCGAHWTGLTRAHCAACHLTFNRPSLFDKHRVAGTCRLPVALGMVQKSDGVWGMPGDPEHQWGRRGGA